jgi:hypothetical protein
MMYYCGMKITDDVRKIMAEMGRRGGKKAAAGMTKKQKIARAKNAVAAREAKRVKK